MASPIIPVVTRDAAISAGLKRYFTGKQCNRGHDAERYVIGGKCAECIQLKNAKNRSANNDYFRAYRAEYYKKKKCEIKKNSARWRKENPHRYAELRRKHRSKNIDTLRASDARYRRERYENDPEFRCIRSLRARFITALSREKISKKGSFCKGLGYRGADLVRHLERQFEKGMTWDNHGEWHIDHITPISKLVREGVTDPSVVNCLSNLRPIWAKENISKGSEITLLL